MQRNRAYRCAFVKLCFIMVLAFMITLLFFPQPAFASWVNPDSNIYKSGLEADKQAQVLETLGAIYGKIKDITSDLLGALFADMIRNAGDSLYYLLSFAGIDMNAIIFGRVGGAAFMNDGISLFTFELVPGNPYGIVASYIYGSIRMVFMPILICIILARLAAYLYTSGGAKQRERLKEALSLSVILLLSSVLMPYLMGVAIYIRDAILYMNLVKGGELIKTVSRTLYPDFMDNISGSMALRMSSDIFYSFFGSTGEYNIVTMFRDAANGSFLNSLMYIGAVVMTAYFAFAYISVALTMVVLFISFPMVSLVSIFDRSVLKNWAKQVLGTLVIPIIDSTLLILPIFFGMLGKSQSMSGYTIVQFILCCCIIPARGCIRMWLGLGGGSSMELAGIGALMGAMQLGKAVAGATMGLTLGHMQGKKSIESDETMASMLTDMQKAKNLTGLEESEKLEDDITGLFGITPDAKTDEDKNLFGNQVEPDPMFADETGFTSDETSSLHMGQAGQAGQQAGAFKSPGKEDQEGMTPYDMIKGKISEMDRRKALLTDDMKKNDVRLAKINKEMALLDEDNAHMKAERDEAKRSGTYGEERVAELDRRIVENEIEKKQLGTEAADIRGDNSIKSGQISRLDTATKRAKDAMVSLRAAGGAGGGLSSREQEVLDSYATIDNFETPEFRNISPEKRAELYRNRAKMTRSRMQNQAIVGAAGITIGTTAAMGATMFSSPAAKMYAAATAVNTSAGIAQMIPGQMETSTQAKSLVSDDGVERSSVSGTGMSIKTSNLETPVPKRIVQKETGKQELIVDKERTISVHYQDGQTVTNQEKQDMSLYQGTDSGYAHEKAETGWIPGGNASDERIWKEVVTSRTGQKQVTQEIRRALTAASSNARMLKRTLDTEPGNPAEKNEELIDNAMNVFASEFSYNLVNSGVISEDIAYSGFDPESYQDFVGKKIRSQAKSILTDKLKSLGLLY